MSWNRFHQSSAPMLRVATLVAIATLSLSAGPSAAESLNDALASTYRYNPQLDAERARLRGTDEEVARAMSGYRPIISATADLSHTYSKTRTPLLIDRTRTNAAGY